MNRLRAHRHEIIAVGRRAGEVNGIDILTGTPPIENLDTVTLYLNPSNQEPYLDYIISLHPRRIIFNPGTENPKLEELAQKNGIQTEEACTLVMLSTGQY